jgi:hypothetical protein
VRLDGEIKLMNIDIRGKVTSGYIEKRLYGRLTSRNRFSSKSALDRGVGSAWNGNKLAKNRKT